MMVAHHHVYASLECIPWLTQGISIGEKDMPLEINEQTRVYAALLTAARKGKGLLKYKDIGDAGGFGMKTTADGVHAGDILDTISRVEHAEGRPLLGSIVVRQDGGIGGGFLTLAVELGRLPANASDAERAAFVKSEQAATFQAWKSS